MSEPLSPAEFAEAALAAPPLARACRLAAWIGDGVGREVTGTGVLRPAAAVEACAELGLELPPGTRRLRSARDVAQLHQAWEVAVHADLVTVGGGRVRAAADAAGMAGAAGAVAETGAAGPITPDFSERIISAWLRAAALPMGVAEESCMICLAVLHELGRADGPADMPGLVRVAAEAGRDTSLLPGHRVGADGKCLCCERPYHPGEMPSLIADEVGHVGVDPADHAAVCVSALADFGAVVTGPGTAAGGTAAITTLGRLLAEQVRRAMEPDPGASAGAAVRHAMPLPERMSEAALAPWLAARTPDRAVRELLAAAEEGDDLERGAALALARKLDPAGRAGWREYARKPGFGAYARQWLISRGEPVIADERDDAWLLVELMARTGGHPPPRVIRAARDGTGDVLTRVERSGHPASGEAADRIRAAAAQAGELSPRR